MQRATCSAFALPRIAISNKGNVRFLSPKVKRASIFVLLVGIFGEAISETLLDRHGEQS